jgi:cob(I)alamin adenosyltransferase
VLDCGIVKIYTRTGDDGTTGLLGPGRVLKSSERVEAYGSVDELNAALGAASALDRDRWLAELIAAVQSQLFAIGAELAATTPKAFASLQRITDDDVGALEAAIDRYEADLPALTRFILPGGTSLGAQLHWSRTVCRRAERRLVSLHLAEPIESRLIRYLNRLGDLLFVLARWSNHRAGISDVVWRGEGG